MKIYKIKYYDEFETNFIICSIKEDSPWFYLCWSLGRRFSEDVKQPILYQVDGKGEIEDYPFTNADQFLVSDKMFNIINQSGAKFDAYKSVLLMSNRKQIKDYKTLNFIESFSAMDWNLSVYDRDEDFPDTKVEAIQRLVIKKKSIPKNVNIFRLAEDKTEIIVTEKLKRQFEVGAIRGIRFEEIETR